MRRLVLFGDSWTNGYYRSTSERGYDFFDRCLGTEISERFGVEVQNFGERANSNQKIANQIIRYVQQEDCSNTAMFIVWSELQRMPVVYKHLAREDGSTIDHPDYLTHMTTDIFREVRKIYPEIGDIAFARMYNEHCIHGIRMILKENNIPYLFANSIDNFWNRRINNHNIYTGNSRSEFIGGGQEHNTLLDILIGLYDNEKYANQDINLKDKRYLTNALRVKNSHDVNNTMTACEHPTEKGVGIIVDKIQPELEKILKEK